MFYAVKAMRRAWVVAAVLSGLPLSAADCARCHPREAREQASSAHAHSLQPVLESHFYSALPAGRPIGEARGGFLLTYQARGHTVEVIASRGNQSQTGTIEWVFGAGRRAETPLVRVGTRVLEHRISFYSAGGRLDLTLGHIKGVSASARDALGSLQSPELVERCFGCHSTGTTGQDSFAPGVQCERCHAGAENHALHGGPVANPGRGTPAAIVKFCAACHRDRPEGDPDDPINARYQPARLMLSKCYRGGKLSCLTCHDPHQDAKAEPGWYRTRCLGCHAEQSNRGDCLPCHMARVSLTPRLSFTDHFIRTRAER